MGGKFPKRLKIKFITLDASPLSSGERTYSDSCFQRHHSKEHNAFKVILFINYIVKNINTLIIN